MQLHVICIHLLGSPFFVLTEALQNSSDELTQEKYVAFCIRQTTWSVQTRLRNRLTSGFCKASLTAV